MIKNIKNLKNIQIVCKNQEQVKDCLNYLKQLGFDVDCYDCENYLIVLYDTSFDGFITSYELEKKYIEFYNKEFVKTLQKFIKEKEEQEKEKKEKEEDYEVTSDGRIIKINNYKSKEKVFIAGRIIKVNNYESKEKVFIAGEWDYREQTVFDTIEDFRPEFLDYLLKYGLAFSTKEARDKAVFKMEIETKLKNIAERLNKGQKIDWEDRKQIKYNLFYNYEDKKLEYYFGFDYKNQGVIYCLDDNFLYVAKKEIGEENLIEYFTE